MRDDGGFSAAARCSMLYMNGSRGSHIEEAMAGEHRRSEREPVHPAFDFKSIDVATNGSERLNDDQETTAEYDALQVPGEEPGADVRGFQARRSMSSPIGASRISSLDASAKNDISARLDAARQRLKRAVDVAGD